MNTAGKRAALHNLGCKVNAYETDAMQQILEDAGYVIVPFSEVADVYVINTCSVTNIADQKSRQMLHRAKKKNPDAIVVAAGCYVQTATEDVATDAAVDIVIGNNEKEKLVALIEDYARKQASITIQDEDAVAPYSAQIRASEDGKNFLRAQEARPTLIDCVDINDGEVPYEKLRMHHATPRTRAFLKVQDGCNQFCSYCIIPYARGRVRSREIADVVAEVRELASLGYHEVVLTGIHLSSFGLKEGYNHAKENDALLDLIEAVAAVAGIERIRLGSLEPQIITEHFTKRLAAVDKICPHFHLSLQSGCDATLLRMNRKYSTAEYRISCEILRKYFRDPAITTDVITGFPGETEEEFAHTLRFVKEIGFYEMHVFPYSKRAGTRAAEMEDQINEAIKHERSAQLIALSDTMSREFRENYQGREVEALLETSYEKDGKNYLTGYTREYIRVAVPADAAEANGVVRGCVGDCMDADAQIYRMNLSRIHA